MARSVEHLELVRFCSDLSPITTHLDPTDVEPILIPARMSVVSRDVIYASLKIGMHEDEITENNIQLQKILAGNILKYDVMQIYSNDHPIENGRESNLIMLRPTQETYEQIVLQRQIVGQIFADLTKNHLKTPHNVTIASAPNREIRDGLLDVISAVHQIEPITLIYGQAEPLSNIGLYQGSLK